MAAYHMSAYASLSQKRQLKLNSQAQSCLKNKILKFNFHMLLHNSLAGVVEQLTCGLDKEQRVLYNGRAAEQCGDVRYESGTDAERRTMRVIRECEKLT